MNKEEKIRAEVERRYNYHKDHADDWAGTCNFWSAHEDKEILSFIDSMQKEPKSKFEQSIQEGDNIVYNEELGCRVNLSQLKRVAKKEEPVSEELEEAAKHYLYSNILYDDVYVGNPTDKDCIEMFKAGAKWQKQQIKKAMDLGEPPYLISIEQAYYRTLKLLED